MRRPCQCPEDMEHQLAARCGGVDGLLHALKPDALPLQLRHQLDQMLERAAKPVEPPDHQHVALAQQLACPLQGHRIKFVSRSRPARYVSVYTKSLVATA